MPETIGVDLGGTKMAVGVVDTAGGVLHRATESSFGRTTEELLDTMEAEVGEAVASHPRVAAAGLGIPCTIDRARGVAINAVNLPISNVPIRDLMRERLGMPVFVDNDANTAMLAEHLHGAARGARNAVMLTIGTGIGGGLILDGRLYRGSTGAGAELGHMVVDMDGPPCQGSCPSHGCLEAVASGTALGREALAVARATPGSTLARALEEHGHVDGKAVTHAALEGDEAARDILSVVGTRLGVGLANLANIFEPDVIVIGGGVSLAGELLIGPARAEMRGRALPPQNETPVVLAELGPEAGMLGAAAMAAQELDDAPEPTPAGGH